MFELSATHTEGESMNDGGPAFPVDANLYAGNCTGMTLRDWFAGMALQGMLATNPQGMKEENIDQILAREAREAYASADAMLAHRQPRT